MNHVMGNRHLKSSVLPEVLQLVELYHNFWLNKDPCIQAHQVYFRPIGLTYMRCSLCDFKLPIGDIVEHIQLNPHKENIMHNFEVSVKANYLIDLQVEAYGVTREPVEEKKVSESSPDAHKKNKPKFQNMKKYTERGKLKVGKLVGCFFQWFQNY